MKLLNVLSFVAFYALTAYAFTNPLKTKDGSDPFMVYSNGYYYLTTTSWSNIQITRATVSLLTFAWHTHISFGQIQLQAAAAICGLPKSTGSLQRMRGFVYYTAGTAGVENQHIHALKSSSSDLWASVWSYAGRVTIPNKDTWSIDATILNHSSGSYLVYSAYDSTVFQSDQCMYIAKLNSPTTAGNASKLSCPTNTWEKIVTGVNEGPAALYHGGRTWIVYSASHCSGTGYALGRLELTGADPLSTLSWTKYNAGPIFQAANGSYAVGHNGFFTAPSGNIYNVYHASPSSAVTPRPISENIPEPA
ncbi:Glycosyl hydrolases family 43 [Rhizoctonia solani]|uniref:Glycosyl hydrolases family 43 n=1 Tax=Rhizoctonia solani TaxID=456999 RepID=A0A8H7I1V1_9AGAM|nr:Glycosyl hydrolases family 43 [Rhizoctonia solani]